MTTPPRLSNVTFRKPGPATSTAAIPCDFAQPFGEDLGDLTRLPAGLLGQHERDVAGVITVGLVARALDVHRVRHRSVELPRGYGFGHHRADGDGEFGRSHMSRVSTVPTADR